MEAALRTPEILHEIFQNLRLEDIPPQGLQLCKLSTYFQDWRETRTTLVNSTLTCHAFLQPAVANLWRTIDGIYPLLRLLPGFEWDAYADGYVLDGGLEEKDFERFDYYAKLVRHMVYLRRERFEKQPVLMQVAEFRPAGRFLPKLQTLVTYVITPALFLLVPSTLQELHVQCNPSGTLFPTAWSLIQKLPLSSKNLRVLEMQTHPHSRCLKAISLLRQLRTVKLTSAMVHDFDVIGSLATLPHLEDLEFTQSAVSFTNSSGKYVKTDVFFPGLKRLAMETSPGTMARLLQLLNRNTLQEIKLIHSRKIAISDENIPENWKDFINTVSDQFKESLLALYLTFGMPRAREEASSGPFLGLMDSAFQLHRLECLVFSHVLTQGLDDTIIPRIISSWPRLRKLHLPICPTSSISFAGLQSLVNQLQYLTDLATDFQQGKAQAGLVSGHLKVLNVQQSPISHATTAASNLATSFPGLEILEFSPGVPGARLWREVQTWLPVILGRPPAPTPSMANIWIDIIDAWDEEGPWDPGDSMSSESDPDL